jgi:hypothetical protein
VGYTASGVRKSGSFVFGSQALSESHHLIRNIASSSTAFWIPYINTKSGQDLSCQMPPNRILMPKPRHGSTSVEKVDTTIPTCHGFHL